MDKLFPFLRHLSSLRQADFQPRLPLLLKVASAALILAALMFSIALWTSINGLSLGDFFMLSFLQILTLLAVWLGAHCLWPQEGEEIRSVHLIERSGELLALAWLYAGAALFIAGFFPSGRVVAGFFSAFPFLGGFYGPAGGIAALALSVPLAGIAYGLLRYLGRCLESRDPDQPTDED